MSASVGIPLGLLSAFMGGAVDRTLSLVMDSIYSFPGLILAIAILWASGLRELLTNLGWILSLFTGLTVLGLLRLRHREGGQRVPIPGYPFVPYAFLIIVFALTGIMVVVNGHQLVPAIALLASGALVLAARKRYRIE